MNIRTDPKFVRHALQLVSETSVAAAARSLHLEYSTVARWHRASIEHGPGWPTQAMVDQYDATREARAKRNRANQRSRNWRILGRGPLLLDATGTHRRLRALQRLGWSYELIALHGPWQHQQAVSNILCHPRVQRPTAQVIAEIYDLLSMQLGPAEKAREAAEAAGYPPPLAWNDDAIDDPAAVPLGLGTALKTRIDPQGPLDLPTVDRILAGDWRAPASKATRTEVVRRWDALGRSRNELARLTGWKPERYGLLEQHQEVAS